MRSDASGATATVEMVVGESDTALALGSGDVEVLGTPRVVALVEQAAVAAIADRLEPGRTTVGTRIDLEHLAPSLVGVGVAATAVLTGGDGRTFEFEVQATMDGKVVARGTHTRVRVTRDGFGQPR